MARVTNELTLVSVERMWAFFKTRTIQRKKGSGFIAGRTLARGGTKTVLTRRVTEVANSRIVEISLRASIETLS